MENVKGLLTKDKGKFKEAILHEIRSIIDDTSIPAFVLYLNQMLDKTASPFVKSCILAKVNLEVADDQKAIAERDNYFSILDAKFKSITRKIDYKLSKSNINIATIRHGLDFLHRTDERNAISTAVTNEKTHADIDNDLFVNGFNSFLSLIDDSTIINTILSAIDAFEDFDKSSNEVEEFKKMIKLYSFTLDETFDIIRNYAKTHKSEKVFNEHLESIRLYRVARPIVAVSSDYGVPQNRERVLFIGCRKDQELIDEVPATVSEEVK